MARYRCIAALLVLLALVACDPGDQARVKTAVAEAGRTAVAEGERLAATKAAQAKETLAAAVATEAAEAKKTVAAVVVTEAAKKLNSMWTIGLDPGHGWAGGPGAVANGMQEKDVTLDIALRTQAILEGHGYNVVLTRIRDEPDYGVEHAAAVMNEAKVDVVVSIHANAGGGTGTEACYTAGRPTDADSRALAALLTEAVAARLPLRIRGIFPENADDRCCRRSTTGWNQLYIHDMNAPAALIETAFIDSEGDAQLLKERRQDFAAAIADAVMAYMAAH